VREGPVARRANASVGLGYSHVGLIPAACMIGNRRFSSSSRNLLISADDADLGATPWPASPAEISKFRDDEEKRLLPIMQAAGIKPT